MEVRALSTLEEIAEACALISRIWQAPAREQAPANLLRAMTWHGNPLLGGYIQGELAAIAFGFWGRDDDGNVWLCSVKTGVAPDHRDSGLLEELRRAQAAWAAARGVDDVREVRV